MTARFAIYLPPPENSALEAFASSWLGRDHISGAPVEPFELPGLSAERQREITKSPRHYGFHATLKAPFALASGRSESDLEDAARAFAHARSAFALRLELQSLNGFIALVPALPTPAIDTLAAACVRAFEPFRAALEQADIERRRQSKLSKRQDEQLVTWGYPYIFEDFHFHMTLTERLQPEEREQVMHALQGRLRRILDKPLIICEIAIYAQPSRNEPFTLHSRLPFAPALRI